MMRQVVLRVALVGVAVLAGCAAPGPPRPSVDPTLSPEQIARTLSNRKLTSRGTSNDGFGLAAFKPFLRPLELRCQADGGQFVAAAPTAVGFDFRDANNVYHQAQVSMPQRLACRSNLGTLWGAAIRYNETTFFPSAWAGETFYYATIPLAFELGEALDRADPNSPINRAARIKEADDCQPWREQYAKQVRTNPAVGMKVKFGVIIEVRQPLVLVQYDGFGKQVKGCDQEWVQVSTLGPGSNCPE